MDTPPTPLSRRIRLVDGLSTVMEGFAALPADQVRVFRADLPDIQNTSNAIADLHEHLATQPDSPED